MHDCTFITYVQCTYQYILLFIQSSVGSPFMDSLVRRKDKDMSRGKHYFSSSREDNRKEPEREREREIQGALVGSLES